MAYKMNGSPAKMGTIQGTAGHASALKQKELKKSEMIEKIKKEMDPKVREALVSFDRPTPGIKTKKPSKEQIKKILEKMKSIKGPGVQLSDDHKKTIEGVEKMIKDQKSPAKQKQQSSGGEQESSVRKELAQSNRQKQIDAIDAKIETLEEQIFNEEITQEQYDEAMKSIRVKEKQVKKPI